MSNALSAPFMPDWVSKPGNTITDRLECHCMSMAELAVAMDNYPLQKLEQVVSAQLPIDEPLAWLLSRELGASKQFWINRQAHYDADTIRLGKGPLPYTPPFPHIHQ